MKKIILAIIASVFLFAGIADSAERKIRIYDLDFDAEASSNEHPSEACTVKEGQGGTARKCCVTNTDCELVIENADEVAICWNTVDDVLGTHTATDWSLLVRTVALKGDSYPTAGATTGGSGTDPVETSYYELDGRGNNQYGCFGLTHTGLYALKIRVKTPSATVAAPSIRIKVEY